MEEIDGMLECLFDLTKELVAVADFGGEEEHVFTGGEGLLGEVQTEVYSFVRPF